MVTSCKDYTAPAAMGFTTSRKAAAVNPITCPIVISAVTTTMSVHPSTTKAGVPVMAVITWRVSIGEDVTNCTVLSSSNVV